MSKGAWTGTSASAIIVAADEYRDHLTVQLINATAANLAFGEAAVAGEGIELINAGDSVSVRGPLATEAVYAIGNGADGVYQDGPIAYRPGPQVAS